MNNVSMSVHRVEDLVLTQNEVLQVDKEGKPKSYTTRLTIHSKDNDQLEITLFHDEKIYLTAE